MTDSATLLAPGDHDRAPTMPDLARSQPDKPALVMTDGGPGLSFADLDRKADCLARALAGAGLAVGDHVAILLPNGPAFVIAAWAAQLSGLIYTPINHHLGEAETQYIVRDCGARVVLTDDGLAPLASGGTAAIWRADATSPSGFDRSAGADYVATTGVAMLYSSGTSGRPKGIARPLTGSPPEALASQDRFFRGLFGFDADTVLLETAPLYHAAPMGMVMSAQRAGGTVVLMPAFDAQAALDAIARHRVTAAWMVPTMFVRLLRLPEDVRRAAGTESLTHVIHSGAPCPVPVKRAMLDWLGPVLHEYYAATEAHGLVHVGPADWLDHPGSVGRSPLVRIVGDDGGVLGPDAVGEIYFVPAGTAFEYHNDPGKTAETRHPQGWTSVGDLGYLDGEGWLYLTDRKSHTIIAGGVNIYPQEAENVLAAHPAVADVAVIGVPDSEYGEAVKAVVVLVDPATAGAAREAELLAWCRERLARYKCPRSVDFVEDLPRLPSGKLMKRQVRDRYWPGAPLSEGDRRRTP